eukprot:1644405-Rhodomonas_salina.1
MPYPLLLGPRGREREGLPPGREQRGLGTCTLVYIRSSCEVTGMQLWWNVLGPRTGDSRDHGQARPCEARDPPWQQHTLRQYRKSTAMP